MKEFGYLFPGQGAQYVGMGRDLYENVPPAKRIYDWADEILGTPISRLCFEGPDEELIKTKNTQVAIFVTSMAALETLKSVFPLVRPSIACGLSLGEFTALVSLKAISFEEGLRLVKRRADLMDEASEKFPGTMASILGLTLEKCEAVCAETGTVAANINSPEQIVISGAKENIAEACEAAVRAGAKRAIPLKVGGAFHSPLMKIAEDGLKEALSRVNIQKPQGHFIPNVTGTPETDPEVIRALLAKQLTNPVQWVKTMRTVATFETKDFLEVGPGKVLKGLAKKIDSSLNICNMDQLSNIENIKSLMSEDINAA